MRILIASSVRSTGWHDSAAVAARAAGKAPDQQILLAAGETGRESAKPASDADGCPRMGGRGESGASPPEPGCGMNARLNVRRFVLKGRQNKLVRWGAPTAIVPLLTWTVLTACQNQPNVNARSGAGTLTAQTVTSRPADPAADSRLPTTSPASPAVVDPPTQVVCEDAAHGYRIVGPVGWAQKASADYTLMLVPCTASAPTTRDALGTTSGRSTEPSPSAAADACSPKLTVDVPALPPHIPGFIPLGSVVSGYLDDQKKRFTTLNVVENIDQALPKSKARRVILSGVLADGSGNGTRICKVVTVLAVHGDRVYLFSAESGEERFAAARAAFDAAFGSLQWVAAAK